MENNQYQNNENLSNQNENRYYKEYKINRRSSSSILVGVLFIFGAIAIVVNHMGFGIKGYVWPVVVILVMAFFLISGLRERSFVSILVSAAILITYVGRLFEIPVLEDISLWVALGASLIASIGLEILFPNFKKKKKHYMNRIEKKQAVDQESRNGNVVKYDNCFGSVVKYLNGDVSEVYIDSSFGSMEVYFGGANLVNNTARINIDGSFGEVKLNIPSDWKVVFDVSSSFGGVEEKGSCNINSDRTVIITGEISFGHLLIDYV